MELAKRIWHGTAWHSEERFNLVKTNDAIIAEGDLAGETEDGRLFVINYRLTLSSDWDVKNVVVQDGRNGRTLELVHKLGRWYDGRGVVRPEFDGVEAVDLSLTPFTNSLPIKTLDLADNVPQEIEVAYITLPDLTAHRATQVYTKLDAHEYLYQNPGTGFEARISVDDQDLVTNYEGLFEVEA